MKKYRSIEYAATVSQKLARDARKVYLENIDDHLEKEYRQVIVDLIDYMVEREL